MEVWYNMQNVTAICYLFSLLFYGLGYFKTFDIRNAVQEYITTYDYTIYISMATVYFVLAIFFAIMGSLFFCIKNNRNQKVMKITDIKLRTNKIQLSMPEYSQDLYRR